MTVLEDRLRAWTGPSSTSEQDKQERAVRMVKAAVNDHYAFSGYDISVFAKGSYPNNTNVRSDSDVDVAVECKDLFYSDSAPGVVTGPTGGYSGTWSPGKLRSELTTALRSKFPGQVETSGSVAIRINANTARVDADVVPCFSYRYYTSASTYRAGTRVFRKDGTKLENYPKQQLENGIAKNNRTGTDYKKLVRILKRVENVLSESGRHKDLPSYFMECLVYNCPDRIITRDTWTDTVRGLLSHLWSELDGAEPSSGRWVEVNEYKYLFHDTQPWSRADGRSLAKAAWNYLGYA